MEIPIELFAIFLGVSVAILGVGLAKKVGAIVMCSGMLIMFTAIITDFIIMGKIPESSTTSGSTTTYVMADNLFQFTELHKVLMAVIGVFIMIIGVLFSRE
jgi:hypothetical protein